MAARCNVQHMTSVDAKMTYIRAWQRLTDSGTAYFIVTFKGCKKKARTNASFVGYLSATSQRSRAASNSARIASVSRAVESVI